MTTTQRSKRQPPTPRQRGISPEVSTQIIVLLCDMYSNQELAEVHFMYGKADCNAALDHRLYLIDGQARFEAAALDKPRELEREISNERFHRHARSRGIYHEEPKC
ncbi:hypothetical protein ANN_11407 [Periplaneta americana]|uniref:Uncharacterized protein n=1 Tax=Periplaneta americana TaxID=6978 RepID=A0ABQ8T4X9_PERAM|nr:hypothetical protein ANN_11407 [Periplaneta americana]